MRYIGGKSRLTGFINDAISRYTRDVSSVFDIFSGTGSVAISLKENGYHMVSNDFLYFSYVMQHTHIALSHKPTFSRLGIADPIAFLNSLPNDTFPDSACFIYQNYSPVNECERMYFQPYNAHKIDNIRLQIEQWKNAKLIDSDEYMYLLTSLIEAIPYVANITGVYAAYLKFWDKRTYNSLLLKEPRIITGYEGECFNSDYRDVIGTQCDLLYADPPYNSREYLPNYHILETIARYDYPSIHGKSGMRAYENQKSPFCKKKQVHQAFETLINESPARYVLISYNNEGLISQEDLSDICSERAVTNGFHLIENDYRRYKSKIPNDRSGLKEQLYLIDKGK